MFKSILPIIFLALSCSTIHEKDLSNNSTEAFFLQLIKMMPLKLVFKDSPDSPASYYHQMILGENGQITPLPEYKKNAIRVDSGSWKVESNILELNLIDFNALCEEEPCIHYLYDHLKIPLKIENDKIQFPKYIEIN